MKVLLIGNYKGDKQESMGRYANMVKYELRLKHIEVKLIYPPLLLGRLAKNKKVNKWIGYIDKYLFAPFYLLYVSKIKTNYDIVHICDHSNAIYRGLFTPSKLVITCHDVLAIKGALGYQDAHCQSSKIGRILQNWILDNLIKIDKIACVSNTTLQQLIELSNTNRNIKKQWKYVPNTFNQRFEPIETNLLNKSLEKFNLKSGAYLLHVGSDLERKNRKILLNLLSSQITLKLVVTHAFNSNLPEYKLNARNIHTISNVSSDNLAAIYQGAKALIFPSLSEGFGWPIIEAQKSGIPVICSDISILREIAGNGALFVNPTKVDEFLAAIEALSNQEFKKALILKGLENIKKFNSKIFTEKLISLYQYNEIHP